MSKVISFLNRKGGTGKTTSAINVATALKKMTAKYEVALIETDSNRTLTALRSMEANAVSYKPGYIERKGIRMPDLLQTDEEHAANLISGLRKAYVDYVIVDGAANMSEGVMRSICANSDFVIIPTGLSMSEVMVTELTLDMIRPVMEAKPELNVYLLANRVHFLTSMDTIRQTFAHLDVPVLEVYIPHFKHYTVLNTIEPVELYQKVAERLIELVVESNQKFKEASLAVF